MLGGMSTETAGGQRDVGLTAPAEADLVCRLVTTVPCEPERFGSIQWVEVALPA
jgi:hypothetical protein